MIGIWENSMRGQEPFPVRLTLLFREKFRICNVNPSKTVAVFCSVLRGRG
jgi:hypothetical protein